MRGPEWFLLLGFVVPALAGRCWKLSGPCSFPSPDRLRAGLPARAGVVLVVVVRCPGFSRSGLEAFRTLLIHKHGPPEGGTPSEGGSGSCCCGSLPGRESTFQ